MKVWVLFVWLGGSLPGSWNFHTKAECEAALAVYKRAVCIEVVVPRNPQ